MIGRVRRHRGVLDDFEPEGMHVFVPAILGGGILVSLGVLLADLGRKLGGGRGERRSVEVSAHYLAGDVLGRGDLAVTAEDRTGLRSRTTYLVLGVALLTLGLYGLSGATFNFLGPSVELVFSGTQWSARIAWIWAGLLVLIGSCLFLGVLLLVIAPRPRRVPLFARRLAVRTPLGRTPNRDDG